MDWLNMKTNVGLFCGILGGGVGALLGGWDVLLQALVLFVVLDYVTGLLAAFCEGKMNSEIGFRGVTKKVLIFTIVAVAYGVDHVLGTAMVRDATIAFYIGIEGLSILENAGRAGVSLPPGLQNALEKLKKEKEEGENHG